MGHFCAVPGRMPASRKLLPMNSRTNRSLLAPAPARGFSDKNFRLCPSTDGRPYLLGFENFLTGVTGRGGKEDGKVPACACDHMCPQTPRTVPKRFICFFLVLRVVCADTCDRRRRQALTRPPPPLYPSHPSKSSRTGRLGLGKCGKGPTRNPSLVQ